MNTKTYWNGEPCQARRVRVIVADAPEFRQYWARDLVGQQRNAVEVEYHGQTFYLDDEPALAESRTINLPSGEKRVLESPAGYDGWAWDKVTEGKGSPSYGHRNLTIDRVIGAFDDAGRLFINSIVHEADHASELQMRPGDFERLRLPTVFEKPESVPTVCGSRVIKALPTPQGLHKPVPLRDLPYLTKQEFEACEDKRREESLQEMLQNPERGEEATTATASPQTESEANPWEDIRTLRGRFTRAPQGERPLGHYAEGELKPDEEEIKRRIAIVKESD